MQEIRLLRIEKYGPRSEKLSDEQLELLEGEPSVHGRGGGAGSQQAEQAKTQTHPRTKPKRQHPGREELPAHLERREVKIPCPPAGVHLPALPDGEDDHRL